MLDQMLVSILLIIASLIAGVLVGLAKKSLSDKQKKLTSNAMTGLVFVLILLMGIKTGLNQDVVSNIGVYGLNALLIALAAMAGSVLFAMLFEKIMFRSVQK